MPRARTALASAELLSQYVKGVPDETTLAFMVDFDEARARCSTVDQRENRRSAPAASNADTSTTGQCTSLSSVATSELSLEGRRRRSKRAREPGVSTVPEPQWPARRLARMSAAIAEKVSP